MALYKRKNSKYWWIRFTAPSGKELRQSTRTADRRLAQEYEDRLKAELWRQDTLGERPRYKWEQAVERYLMEQEERPSLEDQKIHLRWLHGHLYGHVLAEINRDLLDNVAQARKAEGVSNATVNRTMEIARAILRRAAFDWQWIDNVPPIRMLPEPAKRIRWITRDESDKLLTELPEHLAAMAGFSLATGLRQSNVTGLEWSQVDLARRVAWIHGDQAKNKKAINVPLNAEAVLVLRSQVGKHHRWVFTYKGDRVAKANTAAWRKALKRAGIEKFRWHDLRHTWASWHVQAGTPLHALKELGGWSSYEMVLRYAHLSAEHLAEHAENLCKVRLATETRGKLNDLSDKNR